MVDAIVLAEVRVDAIFYIEDERTKVRQPIKEMAQRSVISEMDPDSYKCATVAESEGEREIRNEKERAKSICRRWGTSRKVGMRSTVLTLRIQMLRHFSLSRGPFCKRCKVVCRPIKV